jgi:hypothetical protein
MYCKLSALCLLWLESAAWGQMPYRNLADTNGLFERASASSYVVVATATGGKGILNKLTAEQAETLRRDLEAPGDGVVHTGIDMRKSAIRYDLHITRTVCSQSDFHSSAAALPSPDEPSYIVVPWAEMGSDADVEGFVEGKSYLVFLEKDPQQEHFGELYRIDLSQTYYRAHLRSRGVLELPSGDPAKSTMPGARLLAAVTQLCEAVKPAEAAVKISNLGRLSETTNDPGLKASAEAAIVSLRAEMAQQK